MCNNEKLFVVIADATHTMIYVCFKILQFLKHINCIYDEKWENMENNYKIDKPKKMELISWLTEIKWKEFLECIVNN